MRRALRLVRRLGWLGTLGAGACADLPGTATGCDGEGPATVALGEDTTTFVEWQAGDDVPVELSGRYGIWVSLRLAGFDTSDDLNVFLRYSLDDDPATTDAGALVKATCEDGVSIETLFAPMADEFQTEQTIGALDLSTLHLTATVADASGDSASSSVDLLLRVP